MNFNFYLFDLDGTLLNLGDIGAYVDQILKETFTKLEASNPPNKDEKYKLWSSEEDFFDVLREWGVKNPHNFWKVYDEIDFNWRKELIEKKKIFLYKDVYNILKKIHHHKNNKKLALISNAAYYIVDFILEKFNITSFFHERFSLGYYINDQELAKPSPKGILKILDKFQYDPSKSKAILVGDSKYDIIAAKKANIYACLIRREIYTSNKNHKKWEIQPDFVIGGLNELLYL
ncbi:MAG: HAD family hydrolase [Promethearchaeota archaeon]|nr:MAG: HAD family hydrolase [Candidatus Lokiarchaeota archaeon]